MSLGVFQVEGEWKVYSTQGRASLYPSRDLAMSVAETVALDAVQAGRRVELFIEDENGEFQQAAIGLRSSAASLPSISSY